MVWQRYHLVHVVLIFSRNPQKFFRTISMHIFEMGSERSDWPPAWSLCIWFAPSRAYVHVCTYAMCKPMYTGTSLYIRARIGKNVRWLAPFGNMEYLICPFQFHPHARARPPIYVVAICCTMYILPPDWPPGLSIALWFAHMCICSTRSPLEHWSGLLKYYNQSCKPWNNYWFEFNR